MRDELLGEREKRIPLIPFIKSGPTIVFKVGEVNKIRTFDSYWKAAILMIYGIDVLLATVDLYITMKDEATAEESELKRAKRRFIVDYSMTAIDYTEVVLVFIVMYMLIIY